MEKKYDVCVIGLGYIGLPTASILATKDKSVLGVDINQEIVDTINNGLIHFEEPDLDVLVKTATQSGKLFASTKPQPAEVFIIAVPTPFSANKKDSYLEPDLSYVQDAIISIAPHVISNNLIILESTSPVGTTKKMMDWLGGQLKDDELLNSLLFAHCPERVLPGQMLNELVSNDRIVGGITSEAALKSRDLYRIFCDADIILTDANTAEMAKLTENAFRDVNIAFANELSMICDELDINVWELIHLANRHPRVNILEPGPGVGGHCIAVDPWFIVNASRKKAKLIKVAREVNDSKPSYIIEKLKEEVVKIDEPVIAFLGITFKANVDDCRQSPALNIVKEVLKLKIGGLVVCDPHVKNPERYFEENNIIFTSDHKDAISKANIVVLLVDHDDFRDLDQSILEHKCVVDTRGFFDSFISDN